MARKSAADEARGGQPSISGVRKREIRKRLEWCQQHMKCSSHAEFAKRIGVPRTTVVAWFRRQNPTTPTTANVLSLAEQAGISPTWVLLGEGPELCGTTASADDLGAGVRSYVSRSLATQLSLRQEFVEAVLPSAEQLLNGLIEQHRGGVAYQGEAKRTLERSGSRLGSKLASLKTQREAAEWRAWLIEKGTSARLASKEALLAVLPPAEPGGGSE